MSDKTPTNAAALRAKLDKAFDDLESGALDGPVADVLANLAGKMISSAAVQVKYGELLGSRPKIDFLAGDE